jgi:hypothetical protein
LLSESLLPHAPHIHDDDIDDPMTNRINAKMKATSQPAKRATPKKRPMANNWTSAPLPKNSDFLRLLTVAVLAAGGSSDCGKGGSDEDKVEMFGTVTAVLQFGHGAVTPI